MDENWSEKNDVDQDTPAYSADNWTIADLNQFFTSSGGDSTDPERV